MTSPTYSDLLKNIIVINVGFSNDKNTNRKKYAMLVIPVEGTAS